MYAIDPLRDPRWPEFVRRQTNASVFHTVGWLDALHRVYGHTPIAITTAADGSELTNALLFCQLDSWLAGRRFVSLPFADHCQPLTQDSAALHELLEHLAHRARQQQCRFIELRPLTFDVSCVPPAAELRISDTFAYHALSLQPSLGDLFRRFHKDCVQRKLRRAERECLTYKEGRSKVLLRQFYTLMVRTRRRHSVPPPPFEWFRVLACSMGERLTVRVASKAGVPVASMITLRHADTLTYKYGCSDERYHFAGGVPFLFWKAIQQAKEQGLSTLDLGRSEADNAGLIAFKERLGATRRLMNYYRWPPHFAGSDLQHTSWLRLVKPAVLHLPDSLLVASGRFLYRHIS